MVYAKILNSMEMGLNFIEGVWGRGFGGGRANCNTNI